MQRKTKRERKSLWKITTQKATPSLPWSAAFSESSAVSFQCYFTFVLAILGIVFGVKGRKLAQPDQKGLATAGFVLGIIGTVIGALGIICVVCAVGIFSAAGTAGMLS